jgi:hypothetical protein
MDGVTLSLPKKRVQMRGIVVLVSGMTVGQARTSRCHRHERAWGLGTFYPRDHSADKFE